MRIVSLLPSATEIVYALGLEECLVGVSCDCDFPEGASDKPVVSHSTLTIDAESTPAGIDEEVRANVSASDPIYRVDRELVRELQPDLILAQDLCRVCAVPSGHVTEALSVIGCSSEVLSLDPHGLFDVLDDIERVGRAAAGVDASSLTGSLRKRIEDVRSAVAGLSPIEVLALEWADPPFTGGHWIPEMVGLAGGRDVLGVARAPSRTPSWAEIAQTEAQVVVFMPCGFGLDQAIEQSDALFEIPEFAALPAARSGRVLAVDGSSYFSRPGPRLVDGLELLAWAFHPELFPEPPGGRARWIG